MSDMTEATRQDVLRLFPGLQDHATLEILTADPTVGELETLFAMLSGDDEPLIATHRTEGDRIRRLLSILRQSGIQPQQDRDR